ncbi:MT-A70-domain-containing protein [Dimargaris cristalligena]|uniref:mRNA m(6)A methyltransferase n=1 Tax=Dimargaris cristalligena TaxID=215637 RepID=A0A4P9ZS60_9FUNG|nr:MT-A70-domain-containing protein [Dimargaris cristalligena]|eukprot:RKP36235.1 MT-A70-domain-containing protein [Dimargaris cristalligena]
MTGSSAGSITAPVSDLPFREVCPYTLKARCVTQRGPTEVCNRLHFRVIHQPYTDLALGDCSYLNTCHRMDTCRYIHYELDSDHNAENVGNVTTENTSTLIPPPLSHNPDTTPPLYPPQWLNCDVRTLDFRILGKFSVIMADPPWDIRMTLPYGTMSDEEMKAMPICHLQDEGLLFLWVTGRAMELGRECLTAWGYERVDEIVWIKVNQLQRLIRTGRTGHWLNHSKEHCLVGAKWGKNPPTTNTGDGGSGSDGEGRREWLRRGIDCDVIVSEVRETSRKPDQIYGMIDRLSPGTRKLELFGRSHNTRPGWFTLGNQLNGVRVYDRDIVEQFNQRYPTTPIALTPLPSTEPDG